MPSPDASSAWDFEIVCIETLAKIRWPDSVRCPRCAGARVSRFITQGKSGKPRLLYQCSDCEYQFTVTAGTFFHNSHLSVSQWFLAAELLVAPVKPSAAMLARRLSITYATAWRMHRLLRTAQVADMEMLESMAAAHARLVPARSNAAGRGSL